MFEDFEIQQQNSNLVWNVISFGFAEIDQFKIMAVIEVFKNQFLLKCQVLLEFIQHLTIT